MAPGSFDLSIKRAPRQKRAVETYNRILDVSTRLLTELGVDGMTTNLIADEAGIKVPTLYRYFPNKYAVLMALGHRLMEAQNTIIEQWLDRSQNNSSPGALIEDFEFLIANSIKVTRAEPGAFMPRRPQGSGLALRKTSSRTSSRTSDRLA